ncbi:MAG: carboxylating nicotinate-nucleotide diphosphorylase [Anaerolineaceae bacterium]|nr:carboxylating nicotinate-nucleotide diphosphorylase [Anaerolineaceae bacterium]MCB9101080.1 carboxylating nicotinate-nucleotide diphosphorylase [Anaerolineales bacterium]
MIFNLEEQFPQIEATIRQALAEDIGDGDVTTDCIVPAELVLAGRFIAKQAGVIAGLKVAAQTFALIDQTVQFTPHVTDGNTVTPGQMIAEVQGPGRALLSGERVALNFLQRMSGIATLTRQFVAAVRDTPTTILDTRKTAPGLRLLDKWAVQLGGGRNHRFGLFDMALIKENHIAAAGSITEAVNKVRANDPQQRPIEVEVKNLVELAESLALNVDRVLLDNMSLEDMRRAVQLTAGRAPLEASGNMSLERVAAVASVGVDFISIGMLTHSVQALDISLLLDNPN